MPAYLEELTLRLAHGAAGLPEPIRAKHTRYLKEGQRPDGGFAGREGDGDLYYTGFALRGLAVLGQLQGAVAERAAMFLRGRLSGPESIVDLVSLVYGAALLDASAGIDISANAPGGWQDVIAPTLESLRRDDGGYAKGPEGAASSTYHTFLVLLCLQLIGRPPRQPERVVEFIMSQQSEEGGFREIRVSKRAGTNPTAAAIGALRILDALEDHVAADAVDFLAEMQTDEGGLRANTRIPIADLLSTFTGSLTLVDLGALHEIRVDAARRYAESLQLDAGGFRGAAWDMAHDVEYTFYGVGCLALFHDSAGDSTLDE